MTALHTYQRLEALGLWRATPSDQRRELVVQLGTSSLTLLDKAGRPVAHWSLAAVERVGLSDAGSVIYRPHPDASDTLELDDPAMIAALDQIHAAVIDRTRPPRKWGRWAALGLTVVAVIAVAGYAARTLPGYAAQVLPETRALDLSDRLIAQVDRLAGPVCETPESAAALAAISNRLNGLGDLRLVILPTGQNHAIALPAETIGLPQGVLDGASSPDALAGHILVAYSATLSVDPVEDLFRNAGLWPTLTYLLQNKIDDQTIRSATERLLSQNPPVASIPAILQGFDAAEVSASPFSQTDYAQSNGWAQDLRNRDPYPAGTPNPILADGAWLGLKAACDG